MADEAQKWEPDEKAKAYAEEMADRKVRGTAKELQKLQAELERMKSEQTDAAKKAEEAKAIEDGKLRELLAKRDAEVAEIKAMHATAQAALERKVRVSEALGKGAFDTAVARGLEMEWSDIQGDDRPDFDTWLAAQIEARPALFQAPSGSGVAGGPPQAPPAAAPAQRQASKALDARLRDPDPAVRAAARREMMARA
jgi:hypothetical protein